MSTHSQPDDAPAAETGIRRVREIMQTEVVTVRPELPVRDLVRTLSGRRIGGVPVLDDQGALIGIVTATDVMRLASDAADPSIDALLASMGTGAGGTGLADFLGADGWGDAASLAPIGVVAPPGYEEFTVGDIMRPAPCTVAPEASVATLARMLLAARVHRAPVVSHGRLVGIVTTFDVLRAVAEP